MSDALGQGEVGASWVIFLSDIVSGNRDDANTEISGQQLALDAPVGTTTAGATHELTADISVKLYPNPVEHILNVSIENIGYTASNMKIEVVNLLGKTIHTWEGLANKNHHLSIDMQPHSPGQYFVRVTMDENQFSTIGFVKSF